MSKQFSALGVDIFGGLHTVGVKRAGFDVIAHLEHNDYGVATAQLNHPGLVVHVGKDAWPQRIKPKVDWLFSNPPCAVWSSVGASAINATHWREDPRLNCALDTFELLERYRPTVWSWESVPFALTKGRGLLLEFAERAAALGYAATVLLINAKYLGVPQERTCVFMVLSSVVFEPAPCDYDNVLTVRDVWRGLRERPKERVDYERPSTHELALLPDVPPGALLLKVYDQTHDAETTPRNAQGRRIGRPAIPERRLAFDKPGIPMLSKSFHPTLPRRITVREALRICQLPDDWQFAEAHPYMKKCLLMRAVMPGVAEWLGRGVRAALERNARVGKRVPPALVYDLRTRDSETYELLAGPQVVNRTAVRAGKLVTTRDAAPRVAREPKPRPAPSVEAIEKAKRVVAGTTGSGAEIRRLLVLGKMSDDEIVAHVLEKFAGRKTSRSDVAWNRGMLRKAGVLK